MIFSMNTQDLLEGLSIVTKALAARPAKQILDGVLISAEDGRINLTCSDGSMTIEYTNAADIQEEGQSVIPAKILTELIRKLSGGQVTVTVQNNRQAAIRCMKNRSNISVMNAAEYPEMQPMEGGTTIKIPQKILKDMISHVLFALATDESRQILTGCLLEVSRTEARLVTLDGFRLAMRKHFQPFDLPEGQEIVKAVIPGKVITELSRILTDDDSFCSLTIGGGRLRCVFNNIHLNTVLLAGEYIDYRRIINTEYTSEAKANCSAVAEAIDRASLMAREGRNNLIRMSIEEDILRITSNAELGDVEEEVECSLIGDPLEIAFNAKYIVDIIRNVTEDDLCMKFKSNVSPCIITPQNGDRYLYLILPVRVFQ